MSAAYFYASDLHRLLLRAGLAGLNDWIIQTVFNHLIDGNGVWVIFLYARLSELVELFKQVCPTISVTNASYDVYRLEAFRTFEHRLPFRVFPTCAVGFVDAYRGCFFAFDGVDVVKL